MRTDVIVIGAGGAGLMASMAAADAGAKVVLLEKADELGGTFLISQGTSAGTQTRIQFENGIFDDSPWCFYRDCMKEVRAREVCDPEGLMFYCEHSGFAVDWLDSLGAYPEERRGSLETMYGEDWTYRRTYLLESSLNYLKVILSEHEKRVNRGDITVLLNTQVRDLLIENGVVSGVTADGNKLRSGATVICTGGFTANADLMRQYKFPKARNIVSGGSQLATGDALDWCQSVGAKLVNLDQELLPYMGNVVDPEHPTQAIAYVDLNYPAAIWVDLNGNRICSEDANIYTPPARIAMMNCPKMVLVVITDAQRDTERCLLTKWISNVQTRNWDWFDQQAEANLVVKRADTIPGLATLLGIDGNSLCDTIDRWNSFVEAGQDKDFGRQTLSHKIDTPPYFAIETVPATVISAGGPATNVNQQVIDETGRIIPGLYAAGEVTGYRGFGTGSLTTGNVVYGKQAGVMAADFAFRRLK